jgi:preprotein translocase subunit SecA
MMDLFKKFLGNKSQRDIKEIMPYIDATLEFYEEIRKLSNDELRDKTVQFKQKIADHISEKEKEIEELKGQLNSEEIEIDEKEKLYSQLDKLEKESYELT